MSTEEQERYEDEMAVRNRNADQAAEAVLREALPLVVGAAQQLASHRDFMAFSILSESALPSYWEAPLDAARSNTVRELELVCDRVQAALAILRSVDDET